MSRGNRRLPIFNEKEDYQFFLFLLSESQKKYPFILHGYCLMTNHFHLELETLDTDVSKIMSFLLKSYSTHYNKKNDYLGHLFQDRYKGILITSDRYFLQTSRYIHLNPVKAEIVRFPGEYEFSSYPLYINNLESSILSKSQTLGFFNNSIEEYRKFVEQSISTEEEKNIQKALGENDLWIP